MSPRSNIILWLMATVAVAALTAWAVSQRVPRGKAGPGASKEGASELSLHEWMHHHLDVTAAQHAVLDPLERHYETERVQWRQVIRQQGSALAQAIRGGEPEARIMEIQSNLNEAQGQLQQATLKHFLDMKQHLTPTQAEQLAAWTHDSLLLEPGH